MKCADARGTYLKNWHQSLLALLQDRSGVPLSELSASLSVSERQLRRFFQKQLVLYAVERDVVVRVAGPAPKAPAPREDQLARRSRRFYILYLLAVCGGSRPLEILAAQVARRFGQSELVVMRDIAALRREGLLHERRSTRGRVINLGAAFLPVPALRPEAAEYILGSLDEVAALMDQGHRLHLESLRRRLAALQSVTPLPLPAPGETVVYNEPGPAHMRNRPLAAGLLEEAARRRALVRMPGSSPYVAAPLGVVYTWSTNRWYGIVQREGRLFNVPLNPLTELPELLAERFEYPAGFRLDRYLHQAWGIEAGPPRRLRVRFRGPDSVLKRVQTDTVDRTESSLDRLPHGDWEYVDTVAGAGEVDRWLREFGEAAEILEPPELRRRALDRARRMVLNYEEADAARGDGAALEGAPDGGRGDGRG